MSKRKFIQIACMTESSEGGFAELYGLCNDGTIWAITQEPEQSEKWRQLPDAPTRY